MSPTLPRIAVLCSGSGTNLQAIINAVRVGNVRARVAIVVSDKPKAYALKRADKVGVEARYINPKAFATRASYERALISLLEDRRVYLVCLAGFMRVLSPVFIRRFRYRVLNIHPALLPAFPGAHAIRDALAWGAKVSGVTIHFADENVDHGPIILQEAVTIHQGETEAHLLDRIHRVEHRLYPEAIRLVLAGRVRLVGRTTVTGARHCTLAEYFKACFRQDDIAAA